APSACVEVRPIFAEYKTAGLSHIGWTYLNLNYCPPNMACPMIYRESMTAWRWSGRWTAVPLVQGWVYVHPHTWYGSPWRWAYTQSTGWVTVSGGRFEIRS